MEEIVKWYGIYGRNPRWTVKWIGKYKRKLWIRFGKYGRKASWIVYDMTNIEEK